MTIVRLTLIFAIVLSLGIASASASYQQPKRPSRAEVERARELEKQKRDALAQARVDANTAARQIFEQYHTESCDEPGTWTRKGELLNNYNQAMGTTYKPRYWFTQFRGLHPIAPHPDFGFKKPDAATAANYPDVDYVAEFYITAEVKRNFRCTIKTDEGEIHENFGGCRWELWESPAPVMSLTIWRRGGEWKIKEDIEFHSDTHVHEWDRPSWFKPTCDEVTLGKTKTAQIKEAAAVETARSENSRIQSEVKKAESVFEAQAVPVIKNLFPSCSQYRKRCHYKVINYTWDIASRKFGDQRLVAYGPPSFFEMTYEKMVRINLLELQGNCQNQVQPNKSFLISFTYPFTGRISQWKEYSNLTHAYYQQLNLRLWDRQMEEAASAAPPLCR